MIQIFDADTGSHLGEITDEQLTFLQAQMEEESAEDHDYYLNADLVQTWAEQGADPALVAFLNKIMEGRGEATIRWQM